MKINRNDLKLKYREDRRDKEWIRPLKMETGNSTFHVDEFGNVLSNEWTQGNKINMILHRETNGQFEEEIVDDGIIEELDDKDFSSLSFKREEILSFIKPPSLLVQREGEGEKFQVVLEDDKYMPIDIDNFVEKCKTI